MSDNIDRTLAGRIADRDHPDREYIERRDKFIARMKAYGLRPPDHTDDWDEWIAGYEDTVAALEDITDDMFALTDPNNKDP